MNEKQKERRILSPSELGNLKDEVRELENNLRAVEQDNYGAGTPASGMDKGRIKRQIKMLKGKVREGTPPKLSPREKDKFAKEQKELVEEMRLGMPSRDQMLRPSIHPGSVMKHHMWQQRNAGRIDRWKQIQRMLNPGDPTCSNVENFREN